MFEDCCRHCPCVRPANITRSEPRDVAIVVDFPTDHDAHRDELLQGDSGKVVLSLLDVYDVDVHDVYLTTALNCRPNKTKEGVLNSAMNACRERLIKELKTAHVKRVLCLGPISFSILSSATKVVPITKVRGRWHSFYGMHVLATFDPVTIMGIPDYFRDMEVDVAKFARGNPDPTPNVESWVPESLSEMRSAFDYISDASFVSLDVETTGFSPVADDLLAVGLGVLYDDSIDGLSIVLDKDVLHARGTWRCLSKLLSSNQALVMHNAKFDLKWLKIELERKALSFAPQRVEDTMLLNYCLDERPMGQYQAHSLKNMSRVRCDAPDYDIQMGKWIKAYKTAIDEGEHDLVERLWAKMRTYLSLDCYYTARLYTQLPDEVANESLDLVRLYDELLMPGTLALCDIELRGILADRAFYERTWADLQQRAAPILERLRKATGNPEFNPNSPKQVADLVYTTLGMPFGEQEVALFQRTKEARGGRHKDMASAAQELERRFSKTVHHTARRGKQQEGPTAKVVLKALHKRFPEFDPDDLIPDILEYRNLTKSAGTYVKGMLERMNDDDRIRGDFLQHGTSTGRLSSANPNLQNIPETSHTKIEIRNGFIAPDGYVLLNADYSQLELRLAAHLSGDENFCRVFIEGRDPHQEVAFAFFNKEEKDVTPYERYMAKCVNFGVVYGRGAESIALGPEMDYVEEIGGKRWSVEQVTQFFTQYFEHFPDYLTWAQAQRRSVYAHGYVESPLGRKRRFPLIPRSDNGAIGRQAVNTPIQGTASDFTFSALIRIHARLKDLGRDVAHIISTVHDSILVECREDRVDDVSRIMLEEMQRVPLRSRVPFEAEIKVGKRWGDLHKVETKEDTALALTSND